MALSTEDIQAIVAAFEPRFQAIDERFERIEGHMNSRFDQVMAHIDGLYKLNETWEQEYQAIRGRLGRLEDRVDTLEQAQST